ncbi:uncharacterized protein E5676_scaffold494G00330 [Cucumis melo var. makuwa]|uniref:Integrase catalytic domain-containing protein n=1 Tax=Cucumis melo var. makuwa TaxID=1194695 RepID=A0A5D3DDV4_CUCMM|nr:uncharacterized protein E5676_scaffold494G00330 [Cucumis melo var. makuwa]
MPPILSEYQEANVTSHLIDKEDWRQPIIKYLEHEMLPKDSHHKTKEESIKALKEAHAGVCEAHQSGPKLQFQLRRMSYYWPKMVQDSMDYARKCKACQYHANFIHQPLEPLHPTVASWSFEAWRLDLVGPITPKSSVGHSYILTATDYFSKWVEAIPVREANKENVANFIHTHIIYRYGIPHWIVTDNGRKLSPRQRGIGKKELVKHCGLIESLVALLQGLTTEDNVKLHLQELEALDEKRLEAQQALECYQARMSKTFDKHVKPRFF